MTPISAYYHRVMADKIAESFKGLEFMGAEACSISTELCELASDIAQNAAERFVKAVEDPKITVSAIKMLEPSIRQLINTWQHLPDIAVDDVIGYSENDDGSISLTLTFLPPTDEVTHG